MTLNISRVGTFAQRNILVDQMLTVQNRLAETQTQVNTEQRSQTYSGIAQDAFRLLNLENDVTRVDRFIQTNTVAASRLSTQATVVDGIEDRVRQFRSDLSAFDIGGISNPITSEDQNRLDDIQLRAFEALKDMEYLLNTQFDSRYLFAGGRTDTVPVEIGFASLNDLQAVYDGSTVRWPQSRDTAVENARITDTLDFNTAGTITDTSAGGAFIARSIDQAAGGNLTVNTTNNTLTAVNAGTFTDVTVGSQIRLGGGGVDANNQGFYTVTSVSADGRTVTLNDDPSLGTDETIAGAWTLAELNFPLGQISVSNGGANTGTYSVTDVSLDGNTLTVSPAPNSTVAGSANVVIEPQGYYKGDELSFEHRVNDTRSVTVGINAKDGAFEKAIRAMGIIAQGDLANNYQRVEEALTLLSDSIDHDPNLAEDSSDLRSVLQTIGYGQVTINTALTEGRDYSSFLKTRITEIEGIDRTEAIVRLQEDARSLEVSYQAFSRITQLSLNNFL